MKLQRLLIVRPDRIGDLMLVTPLLAALHDQHPDLEVDVLGRRPAIEVLAGNPAVRGVLDASWDDRRLEAALAGGRYDAVVHLIVDQRLVRLCAGIPRSVRRGWIRWPGAHQLVPLHRSRSAKSEALYNADLVLPLVPGLRVEPIPRIHPSAEAQSAAARVAPRPRVVINPGSGHPEGAWPAERFAAVARALRPELGTALVLWGPGEERLARLVGQAGEAEVAPATDLATLAALAGRAAVFVTNDTGPMHVAAAAGAPLVVVWDGSRVIRPRRWGHHFRPDIVNFDPFDGTGDSPQERRRRLETIGVEQVVAAARKVARREGETRAL